MTGADGGLVEKRAYVCRFSTSPLRRGVSAAPRATPSLTGFDRFGLAGWVASSESLLAVAPRHGRAIGRGAPCAALRLLCSSMLHEPQIERREYQDNSHVYYQPLTEVMPEDQDVHADHDTATSATT